MNVRLLHDLVLVKIDPMAKTIGSIVIPDIFKARDVHTATVMAAGPGRLLGNGQRASMEVSVGDRVAFHRWNVEHKNGEALCAVLEELGPDFALIKEGDVLFVWPPDEEHTFW